MDIRFMYLGYISRSGIAESHGKSGLGPQSCVRRGCMRGTSETGREHSLPVHAATTFPRRGRAFILTTSVPCRWVGRHSQLDRNSQPCGHVPLWSQTPHLTLSARLHRLGSGAAEGALLQPPVKSLEKNAPAPHFRFAFSRLYFPLLFRTGNRELRGATNQVFTPGAT